MNTILIDRLQHLTTTARDAFEHSANALRKAVAFLGECAASSATISEDVSGFGTEKVADMDMLSNLSFASDQLERAQGRAEVHAKFLRLIEAAITECSPESAALSIALDVAERAHRAAIALADDAKPRARARAEAWGWAVHNTNRALVAAL